MSLYDLLTDRGAVNVLKVLYVQEVEKSGSYTMKLAEVKSEVGFSFKTDESLSILSEIGLIVVDDGENDKLLSITEKGKEFIGIFDQLKEVFDGKKKQESKIALKYELTPLERKILVFCLKIGKEVGSEYVSLKSLAEEVYPTKANNSTVSRYANKLCELNLLDKKKEGRNSYYKVTDKGKKTVKEQFLQELLV